MSIAYVGSADLGNNGGLGGGLTASYTVGGGANRLLVVAVKGDNTDTVTGVTYNGVSMTLAAKAGVTPYGNRWNYLFFLLNPDSGANNVVVSGGAFNAALAADYTGVKQTAQPDATGTANSSGSSYTLAATVTTVADNSWAIMSWGGGGSVPPSAVSNCTLRTYDHAFDIFGLFDSNADITPAGSYTETATFSSGVAYPNAVIASFAPVSTAATSYTLMGPMSGDILAESTDFTVTPVGGTSTATITPDDGGTGGTFTPANVTFSGAGAQTFAYTPAVFGPITISTTNSSTLTNPSPLTYTSEPFGPVYGVYWGSAKTLTAENLLPGESITWSALNGWVTPTTGSQVIYTAPLSGAYDVVTWTSDNFPGRSASVYIYLNGATGYQFTATDGAIDFGNVTYLESVQGLALSFDVQFTSSYAGSSIVLCRQLTGGGSGNLFQLIYDSNKLQFYAFSGPLGPDWQVWYLDGGGGHDYFGGLALDAWHNIAVEWAPGYCMISLDGTQYTAGGTPSGLTQQTFDAVPHLAASTTAHLVIGTLVPVGMMVANPAFWVRYNVPSPFVPMLSSADCTNLAAWYPAQVIESLDYSGLGHPTGNNNTVMVDALPINGTATEVGFLGVLSATVTDGTIVAGPALFPPYLYTVSMPRTLVHTPGSASATAQWANAFLASPAQAVLTLIDTSPATDHWNTVTLQGVYGLTATASLAVDPGVSGPYPVAQSAVVTNNANLLAQTVSYAIEGASKVTFATGFPCVDQSRIDGTGRVLFGRLQTTTGGVPVAITGLDGDVSASVTVNGTRTIPLDLIAYDGISGDFWAPLTRQYQAIVDETDGGCTLSGGSWSASSYSTPSVVPCDGIDRYNSVYSQVAYSAASGATATYSFPSLPYCGSSPFGNQYQVQVVYRDNFPGPVNAANGGPYCPNSSLTSATPTTHANYHLDGGGTTQDVAVDQNTTGSYDDAFSTYRWSNVGTPVTVNSSGTLTVTVTNPGHASGPLIVDAVRVKFVPTLVQSSDTLTFSAGDSLLTCATQGTPGFSGDTYSPGTFLDTTGQVTNYAVGHWADSSLMPFNPNQARTLKIGHNPTIPSPQNPGIVFANRLRVAGQAGSSFWQPGSGTVSGDLTIDQYGRLTALNSGKIAQISLCDNGDSYNADPTKWIYNGVDWWGFPVLPNTSGSYSLTCVWDNTMTWDFTIDLVDLAANSNPSLVGGGFHATTGTRSHTFTFNYVQPTNTPDIRVKITANTTGAGGCPQNLKIFDSLSASATTEGHPSELARWQGGGPLRWMDTFHTNAVIQAYQADYPVDGGAAVEGLPCANWVVNSVQISAIDPVNVASDCPDYWPPGDGIIAGQSADNGTLKLTLVAGPYTLGLGQLISFSVTGDGLASNRLESNGGMGGGGTSGIGFQFNGGTAYVYKVNSPTEVLILMGTNDTYASNNTPVTAVTSYTPSVAIYAQVNNTGTPTFESTVRITTGEAQVPYHCTIMVGEAFQSATLAWKAATVLANTSAGTPCYFEYANEPFGQAPREWTGTICGLIGNGQLGGGSAIDFNYSYGYFAAQAFWAIKQAFVTAGRGADFVPVINTNGYETNDQLQAIVDYGTNNSFDAAAEFANLVIGVSGYLSNNSQQIAPYGEAYQYGPMGGDDQSVLPIAEAYDALDEDGLVTLYAWHVLQQGAPAAKQAAISGLVSAARGSPYHFASAKASCYEWALQSFSPYSQYGTPYVAARHLKAAIQPRVYDLTLAACQGYLQYAYGGTYACYYTTDNFNDIESGAGWQVYTSIGEPDGDGSAVTTTNPGQLAAIESQIGGAIAFYNTSTPTPTPTPTQLVITTEPPSSVVSLVGFGLIAKAEDSMGNVGTGFTGAVTVSLSVNPHGGTLAGMTTVSASAGVATFTGLTLNKVGSGYALQVTSSGLTPATSSGIAVTPGTAASLSITRQPPLYVLPATTFRVTVEALDAGGNVATGFIGNVTVAILANPAMGTLGGTLTVAAVAGVATFTDLTIDNVGNGYTLRMTAAGLTGVTTRAFDVVTIMPETLFTFVSPATMQAVASGSPAPAVQVGVASGMGFYPGQVGAALTTLQLDDALDLSSGLNVTLMIACDPLNAAPGTDVVIGVAMGKVDSGTSTGSPTGPGSPLAGSTEVVQVITMPDQSGVLATSTLTLTAEDIGDLAAGDYAMIQVRRLGNDGRDTNSRRVVLLGIDVSEAP